jgi:hypothetical protein
MTLHKQSCQDVFLALSADLTSCEIYLIYSYMRFHVPPGIYVHQITTADLGDMAIELLHNFSLYVETCVMLEEGTALH